MIPFTLSRLSPSVTYADHENVVTLWDTSTSKTDMILHVIKEISVFMYEKASKKFGHGLTLSSYDDYCEQWWGLQECTMGNFQIFEVHFFEGGQWNELCIEEYAADIYTEYIKLVNLEEKK